MEQDVPEYDFGYIVRDSESGNIIDEFATLDEAQNAIEFYEDEDRDEGSYDENFYEIVESHTGRIVEP